MMRIIHFSEGGRLCDIAPTLIEIMGLEKPVEMTGESLLVKEELTKGLKLI